MSPQEFINSYVNRYVDFDNAYGYQCEDEVQFYNRDVVGNPRPFTGNAKDIINQAGSYYTVAAAAKAGDIAVWDGRYGRGSGHTAVVESADGAGFWSLDQNWPLNYPCNKVRHSISEGARFLRPNKLQGEDEMVDNDMVNKIYALAYNEPVSDAEHAQLDGKVSAKALLNLVTRDDNPRRNNILEVLHIGEIARTDHWDRQIADLSQQLQDCKNHG